MLFEGCQSKSKDISLEIKTCPQCGAEIEVFSVDTEVACENCGFIVYNDKLNCAQWCQYAKQCVGEEMQQKMLQIAEHIKAEQAAEKAAREAARASKAEETAIKTQ